MEFITGVAVGLALFSLLGGAYLLGSRHRVKPKAKAEPMDEEQKRRAAQLRKEYNEIMSYDVDKARGGTS